MNKAMLGVCVLLTMASLASAAMYDDFSGDGVWAYPSGTSPNGQWTYDYRSNQSWTQVSTSSGVLYVPAYPVSGTGPVVASTQSWAMPTTNGESLTFDIRLTSFYESQDFYLVVDGDVTDFAVQSSWANGNYWVYDQFGTDTGVALPAAGTWNTVSMSFWCGDYAGQTNYKLWQVRLLDADGNQMYSSGPRPLYQEYDSAYSKNTTARLSFVAGFADMAYDSVEVTAVPEPVTLTLLVMGGLTMLRKRA